MAKKLSKACPHRNRTWTCRDGSSPNYETRWFSTSGEAEDAILSVRCDDCREQLSLGKSDEAPVAVEIRAVTVLDQWTYDQKVLGRRGFYRFDDRRGWEAHVDSETPGDDEWAGYLSREIATHDAREIRDASAWSWDAKRPVVGQYEEWQAARHPEPATTGTPLGLRGHAAWCVSLKGNTGACDCDGDSEDATIEADAARQAEQDGYTWPVVVAERVVGEEPDHG